MLKTVTIWDTFIRVISFSHQLLYDRRAWRTLGCGWDRWRLRCFTSHRQRLSLFDCHPLHWWFRDGADSHVAPLWCHPAHPRWQFTRGSSKNVSRRETGASCQLATRHSERRHYAASILRPTIRIENRWRSDLSWTIPVSLECLQWNCSRVWILDILASAGLLSRCMRGETWRR